MLTTGAAAALNAVDPGTVYDGKEGVAAADKDAATPKLLPVATHTASEASTMPERSRTNVRER